MRMRKKVLLALLVLSAVLLFKVYDWQKLKSEASHFYVEEVRSYDKMLTKKLATQALKYSRVSILSKEQIQKYENRINVITYGPIIRKSGAYFKVFRDITYKECKRKAIQIKKSSNLSFRTALLTQTPYSYLRGIHKELTKSYLPFIKKLAKAELFPKTWDELEKLKLEFQKVQDRMTVALR